MPLTFSKIAVFGAGTMGSGIAQVCAAAGCDVVLCDPAPDAVRRALEGIRKDLKKGVELKKLGAADAEALFERISSSHDPDSCAGTDLVIEAVFEKMEIKRELFSRLDDLLPPPAVLATNTSSLSVTQIAGHTRFPDRVCGLHFFNPAQRMKLVEVVAAQQSSEDTVMRCLTFVREIGREPVRVADSPGFIVNRCARPYYGEALRCLGEGIADVKTIDEIMTLGGFPMGPFALMDLIGLDINYAATRQIWEAFFHDPRYRPHLIQRKMLEAGLLGKKSGRGFYDYSNE